MVLIGYLGKIGWWKSQSLGGDGGENHGRGDMVFPRVEHVSDESSGS